MHKNPIRKAFEETTVRNFDKDPYDLTRNEKDEYINSLLEDHWQTFQEGWQCAIDLIKECNKMNTYTSPISDGGMDPRDR
jgi:hypothetical protein